MKKHSKKPLYYSILNSVKEEGKDILNSDKFKDVSEHIQHGSMSVRRHSINVARYSLLLCEKLHINCNKDELIRGALLHDYFLYDWHDKDHINITKLHGFYHPSIALQNAKEDYVLTQREEDIIKRHMWPMTPIPPRCKEAWIVTAADKYCSLLESLRLHQGNRRSYQQKMNMRKSQKKMTSRKGQ